MWGWTVGELHRRRTEVRSDLGCFPLQLRSSRASAGIIATPITHGWLKKGYQDTTRKMTEGGCTSLILVLISIITKKMLRSSAVQSLVTGSSTKPPFLICTYIPSNCGLSFPGEPDAASFCNTFKPGITCEILIEELLVRLMQWSGAVQKLVGTWLRV